MRSLRLKNLCQYGAGGQVLKTPIGPPPPPPSGGRLKQRVVAKKKAEMKDYMDDVKGQEGFVVRQCVLADYREFKAEHKMVF
jgi:hypothetical protein